MRGRKILKVLPRLAGLTKRYIRFLGLRKRRRTLPRKNMDATSMKRGRAITSAISQIWESSRAIIRIGELRAAWMPFSKRLLRRKAHSWRRPRRDKPRRQE